jgi:hypothetical protein
MYLTCDISKPTAINYSNPSPAPAEASSSNIKQTRKSPYNTRPPKKPSLPTPEENLFRRYNLLYYTPFSDLRKTTKPY